MSASAIRASSAGEAALENDSSRNFPAHLDLFDRVIDGCLLDWVSGLG
jgi:hypothetical protein